MMALYYWVRWRLNGQIKMTNGPAEYVTFYPANWRRARYLVRHYRKLGYR